MVTLNSQNYREILRIINDFHGNFKDLESIISFNYSLPQRTASSIISINVVRRMKYSHYKLIKNAEDNWKLFQENHSLGEELGILLRMANEIGSCPSLLAKVVLECYLRALNEGPSKELNLSESINATPPSTKEDLGLNRDRQPGEGRNTSSRMMRDTTLIENGRLSLEIFLCNLYDDQYGPISEIYNRAIGEEYEQLLYYMAKKASLSFQSEQDLRQKGYDKTPDLKLNVPIAIGGFVVNWIESKGLFGDEAGHNSYICDQYSSYWNRFGPGLVIYWLGYEESIADPLEKRFIIRSAFPTDIIHTRPLSLVSHIQQFSNVDNPLSII